MQKESPQKQGDAHRTLIRLLTLRLTYLRARRTALGHLRPLSEINNGKGKMFARQVRRADETARARDTLRAWLAAQRE